MADDLVLVTGGTGFLGVHCSAALLAKGYRVRATTRILAREVELRSMLANGGVEAGNRLEVAAADLTRDDGWKEAVAGCAFVLHVASPFPSDVPKDPAELIVPAREGTRRVLRAARDAGVRRVVVTSSFAAIGYGHPQRPEPFTEADWTDLQGPGVSAYAQSKTLAERAAWEFLAQEGGDLQLATVNPVGIFGPVWGADLSTSILLTQRILNGSLPGLPDIYFGEVDVRDVADLHVLAMTADAANGQRFLAVAGQFVTPYEVAVLLREHAGPLGRFVKLRRLPNWMVRLAAVWDPAARQVVPELGVRKDATAAKAEQLLGWKPRPVVDSLVDTARSLGDLGLLQASQGRPSA